MKAKAARHSYGSLFVHGSPIEFEFFRATFGGLIPCGGYPLSWAADTFGCCAKNDSQAAALGSGRNGTLLLVRRGVCPFPDKAICASRAGAAGVIVINSEPGIITMQAGSQLLNTSTGLVEVTIPVLMIANASGEALANATARGSELRGALTPYRDNCIPPVIAAAPASAAAAGKLKPTPTALRRSKSVQSAEDAVQTGTTHQSAGSTGPKARGARAGGGALSWPFDAPSIIRHWDAAPGVTEAGLLQLDLPDHKAGTTAATAAARMLSDQQLLVEVGQRLPNGPVEFATAHFGAPVLPQRDQLTLAFAEPHDACAALANSVETLAGALVVVYRGNCSMVDKARRVQAAGSAGVIIVNTGAEPSTLLAATAAHSSSSVLPDEQSEQDRPLNASEAAIVRAIGDDSMLTQPVHIPVVMVTSETAKHWVWRSGAIGSPSSRSIDSGSVGEARNISGVTVTLRPSLAKAAHWEELAKLLTSALQATSTGTHGRSAASVVGSSASGLPSDAYQRQRLLLRLVRAHHPSSITGSPQRYSLLQRIVRHFGPQYVGELMELEAKMWWEDGEFRIRT